MNKDKLVRVVNGVKVRVDKTGQQYWDFDPNPKVPGKTVKPGWGKK